MSAIAAAALLWLAGDVTPHRTTVFLDFDGGTIVAGDNAALDEASCVSGELPYPGFTGAAGERDAILAAVEALVDPYGVRVTREQPPDHLPYIRVLFGGRPEDLGLDDTRGGASCVIDCGDGWARDMAFVFTEGSVTDAAHKARIAVHEVAHSWGLEHVEGETNLMYERVTNVEQQWATDCTAMTGDDECAETHGEHCDAGLQNSHAELLAIFGANSPDTVPPTVTIVSPEDGSHVATGTVVTFEVEVTDDHGGVGWVFRVPGLAWEQVAYAGETALELPFPEGVHTLEVEAIDHDRNVTVDQAVLTVSDDPPLGTTDSGGGTDGGSESTDGGADGMAAGSGCGCGAPRRGAADVVGLVMVLIAAARRRPLWQVYS